METPEKKKVLCLGLDIGTMNIALARSDNDEIKITRNVFLPVDRESINITDLTSINYVETSDNNVFIIGDDAFKFANIFGKEVSRPMQKGLISPKEINAIDVLSLIVKSLIGETKDKVVYCSYSVPAEAIDEGRSITYHEKVFARLLGDFGINHTSVNEGMAIVYSECEKEKFSGIGISFGAGMCNVCISYKGVEATKFSTARSGDWIDNEVAKSLGLIPNRVTSLKEKYLNLEESFTVHADKKVARIVEALQYYYSSLVNNTIKKIISEFKDKVEIEVDESLPIIISGGTSLPKGFLNLFKTAISSYTLPFGISEVRQAKNPLTAVATGLLIKTMADVKGLKRKE
jgi:actin-like ATPase involved in cell morphogenesis